MAQRDIVVIGASAGGVVALQTLARLLPADFRASVFIVLHISPDSHGLLPEILERAGPLPATHGRHREEIRRGQIYVAPPDRHLLLNVAGHITIGHGPKENRFRPAVDPLFRSAALTYGPRVIGIVLTGGLDDGTAGLCAVRQAGGMAIAQDPRDAEVPSMPASAIRHVGVDHVLTIEQIAAMLPLLVREPIAEGTERVMIMADDLRTEVDVAADERQAANLLPLGRPSLFTCPECHGSLLRVHGEPVRYRCHTGHAFTAMSLEDELRENIEDTTWTAVRALQEHAILLGEMASEDGRPGPEAADLRRRAEKALQRAAIVRQALSDDDDRRD